MNEKLERWRRYCLISYFVLLITVGVWYFMIAPPKYIYSTILSVAYFSLLLTPLFFLLKKKLHVYAWSSFMMLLYISHAIVEIWANDDIERIFAIVELLSSSVYFISATICVGYVKKMAQEIQSN